MTFGLNLFAQKAKEDKKYKHKKQEGNSIQLIVGKFTQRLTTKAFDYAQFFYHGDISRLLKTEALSKRFFVCRSLLLEAEMQ